MNKYTIKKTIPAWSGAKTFLDAILNKNHEFVIASNSALEFKSAREARAYWWKQNLGASASVYVCGPKGGFHPIAKPGE